MECKYHKIRTKKGIKYGYCIYNKEEVCLYGCKCPLKEYKEHTIKKKSKSYKIVKLEKNRFSILTNDLEHCIVCGKPKQELHEVYEGVYRNKSMQYGCVIPLCNEHHMLIHKNKELKLYYKIKTKDRFIKTYPNIEFNKLFFFKE